ncbi:helix-turn-helix domain-containing protein [Tetragenococcus muriaticus]|uniref:Fis family helix-turn-helix (HTH) domain-containing protein n=1 Tax=Tetragenococcus muriaticus 3MR10-3 TaxID=1302648 RepID=A0A091BYK7_9ENTE|nr:helix-turn-helix domain-containing protein [Tetragenococcus muriaticus]KFN89804.1 Fis family helix-turn-helix (HTH) domain-containing protein [Tetragenococcus muriaticus 3MR10-3]
MNRQKLQEIYSDAFVHAFPTTDANYLSIAMEHSFLWIPQKYLTKTEKKLLQAISVSNTSYISSLDKEYSWYNSLFSNKPVPENKGRFRLIQVEFQNFETNDLTALQNEIRTILPYTVDLLFLSKNYGIVIEAFSEEALSVEELEGVFLALDSDFNSYTRLFVGSFHSFEKDFSQLFYEEEQLFLHGLNYNIKSKVFDTASSFILFFISHDVTKSYLMQSLFSEWFESEFIQMIAALWKTQGNLSSAAKELFMHRNTLQYKVDKFQQQTKTNLKKMDDLFLCYLLIRSFNK